MRKIILTIIISSLMSAMIYRELNAISIELCNQPNIDCSGSTVVKEGTLALPAGCKVDGLEWHNITPCDKLDTGLDKTGSIQDNVYNPQETVHVN